MDSNYLVKAIIECEQTVSSEDQDQNRQHTAFKNLGNLLQGIGEFDRAIVWHSLALEKETNLAEIYCQIGELYILESNWLAALAAFENALEQMPNSDRIYSSLAQINGHLQRKDAEMECWYKATEINPNLVNNTGYYKLGKALEQSGNIEAAINCYEKAIAGEKGLIAAFYDLGDIYLRQRKLDQAQSIYEKILAVQPTEARAQYKLGTLYLQKKDFEAAIASFHQTIKSAPDFPWAYRDLVKTFLILGKWDETISTCYAILNLVEEYPWVYGHLGNALREKGRLPEAASNFQKACEYRGWDQCVTKDYFFTLDIFSYRIGIWSEHLKSLIGSKSIKALEVGCYQGMSACWMIDEILTKNEDQLVCIDGKFDQVFEANIVKTGAASRVTFLPGETHSQLASLTPESFDLVNLQDRNKLSQSIEQNTALAWKALKSGGFIIFNYYGWRNSQNPQQNPKLGIDQFLKSVSGQWEQVHRSPQTFQLFIRKL